MVDLLSGKKMKYNFGDVVQLVSMQGNRYAIIIEVDGQYPTVYRILIQGETSPVWLSAQSIARKIV